MLYEDTLNSKAHKKLGAKQNVFSYHLVLEAESLAYFLRAFLVTSLKMNHQK